MRLTAAAGGMENLVFVVGSSQMSLRRDTVVQMSLIHLLQEPKRPINL